MNKLEHFMLPENTNALYKKETISSISLTKDVANKINELIDAYNELSTIDLEWKQTQEGTIRKAIVYIKDNLFNTIYDLVKHLEAENYFDNVTKKYITSIEARLENLLSAETSDGELLDIRVGFDNVSRETAGKSIREQFFAIIDLLDERVKETIKSLNVGKLTTTPNLYNGFVRRNTGQFSNESYSGVYKRTSYVKLPYHLKRIEHNFTNEGASSGYAFYDKKKVFISGGSAEVTEIPENAYYVAFTSHNLQGNHSNKTITFYVDDNENVRNLLQIDNELYLVKECFDGLRNGEISKPLTLVDGFVDANNGELLDTSVDGFYKRSDYILIPYVTTSINTNVSLSSGRDGIGFYDVNYNFISSTKDTSNIKPPINASYIVITNYDNTLQHLNKHVVFICDTDNTLKSNMLGKLVTFGDSHVERGQWQGAIISRFNITNHVNLGVGSSTVAVNSQATKTPFVNQTRIDAIINENPDTLIIIGGTNDVHLETPTGTNAELKKSISTKDKSTFYGAYSFLIETILAWKPSLKIMLCTVPQGTYDTTHPISYYEISNIIKEIANYYSLPLADIFGRCGINKTNLSTYSSDSIHYNQLGNDRVAKEIISTIKCSYIGG